MLVCVLICVRCSSGGSSMLLVSLHLPFHIAPPPSWPLAASWSATTARTGRWTRHFYRSDAASCAASPPGSTPGVHCKCCAVKTVSMWHRSQWRACASYDTVPCVTHRFSSLLYCHACSAAVDPILGTLYTHTPAHIILKSHL